MGGRTWQPCGYYGMLPLVALAFDHDREYYISQLMCSEDTLVAESSLETMLSPLQNCSEGGLIKAELNYDATTTNNFA